MKYFLTIGGRKYDFLRMHFRRKASTETQSADLLLNPAKGSTLPAINEAVLIEKEVNNTKMTKWEGKVNQVQFIPLPNNTVKVVAYDKAHKVNFVNVANIGYASQKGSSIFSTEVAPASTTDLTAGTVDTSDLVLDSVAFGKLKDVDSSRLNRKSAFDIIQSISDRDIYIQRNGTTDFLNGAGVDRSTTHILEHGLNCNLMPDIGYTEDETRRVKQVIIKGTGIGTNFRLGSAGTASPADKVKQIELPYVQTNDTADKVATNVLAELDKLNKFAQVQIPSDVFKVNYDVFDTVKLKAKLPNKTINENMKIYSIDTIVSGGLDDIHETVNLELQNFRRAVWAEMSNPLRNADNAINSLQLSEGFTQAGRNINPDIPQQVSLVGFDDIIGTSAVTENLATFNSKPIMGVFVQLTIKVVVRKTSGQFLVVLFSDGTTDFPTPGVIPLEIKTNVGDVTYLNLSYRINADISNKTLQLKMIVGSGEIEAGVSGVVNTLGY